MDEQIEYTLTPEEREFRRQERIAKRLERQHQRRQQGNQLAEFHRGYLLNIKIQDKYTIKRRDEAIIGNVQKTPSLLCNQYKSVERQPRRMGYATH